jgi:Zn-finger nucleic acid-binding protein
MQLTVKNTRKLSCPRCKGGLRIVDIRGVELDACPDCQGVWFDQFEIESFLRTKRDLPNYVPPGYRKWVDSGGFAFGFVCGKVVQAGQWFNGYTGKWEWGRKRPC